MAKGMIEKKAKIAITIKQPTGLFVDGKATFTDIPALCMFFDFTQQDIDSFGAVANGRIFLIAPLASGPKTGAKITHDSETFDIMKIKTLRGFKSEVLGYRCVSAGA